MKKATNIIIIAAMFSSLALFSSCDKLENIPLNIPIQKEFTITSSQASASESATFCLNQYKEWNDNKDKIQSVKFLSAAYWTIDFAPDDLKATIGASVKDKNGVTLFAFELKDVSPKDYMGNNGFKIELSQQEIDYFNDYLNNLQEDPTCTIPSFTAEYHVSNVQWSGANEYTLHGKVEIVLETEVSAN